jgi:hypothetical protein
MKRKRETKGASNDFNKMLYLLIVISYFYVLNIFRCYNEVVRKPEDTLQSSRELKNI